MRNLEARALPAVGFIRVRDIPSAAANPYVGTAAVCPSAVCAAFWTTVGPEGPYQSASAPLDDLDALQRALDLLRGALHLRHVPGRLVNACASQQPSQCKGIAQAAYKAVADCQGRLQLY